jgi:Arc/MetJ-type ribon-helix-helix transcriptional regulator
MASKGIKFYRQINLYLSPYMVELLDRAVKQGYAPTRSDLIRDALRDLLTHLDLWRVKSPVPSRDIAI